MNKNIIIAAIALLAITGTVSVRSEQQKTAQFIPRQLNPNSQQIKSDPASTNHWAVIIEIGDAGGYSGIVTYVVSRSSGSPAVVSGEAAAQTIANMLNAGASMHWLNGTLIIFTN